MNCVWQIFFELFMRNESSGSQYVCRRVKITEKNSPSDEEIEWKMHLGM